MDFSDTLHCMKFAHLIRESARHTSTLLFIGGFIFDLIILPKAGHIETVLLGFLYLFIVAFSIALREWVISRNTASAAEQKAFSTLTFIIAYFSGSALSFVCVYTIRGAAFAVSWPLLLILLICILVNEIISSHQFRFTLDIGVFLLATLFFIIFNLPVALKVQNDMVFLLSLGVAVLVSLIYIYLLQFTSDSAYEESPRLYALALGIPMFIGMMYFLNVIPAVPLSLAGSGIYHSMERTDSGVFSGEREIDTRMFKSLRLPVYHLSSADDGVYFFSSVEAPAELSAPLSHVWEYYNPDTKHWEEKTTIAFTLAGGREDGYRSYSQKQNVVEGLWRVTVKVDSNRIVGRVKFYIIQSETVPDLVLVKQ